MAIRVPLRVFLLADEERMWGGHTKNNCSCLVVHPSDSGGIELGVYALEAGPEEINLNSWNLHSITWILRLLKLEFHQIDD